MARIPLSGQRQSTRLALGATATPSPDMQSIDYMYPHSDRGWRQFPGISEPASLDSNDGETNTSNNFSGDFTGIDSSALNSDGTKIWIAGTEITSGNSVIKQYTLSTAYDVSTVGSVDSTLNITSNMDTLYDIKPISDTQFFVLGDLSGDGNNNLLHRYTMSTANDLSTATKDTGQHIFTSIGGSNTVGPFNIYVSSDGLKMLGVGDNAMGAYTFSSANDHTGVSQDAGVATIDSKFSGQGFVYNESLRELIFTYTTSSDDNIFQFGTAFDPSTAVQLDLQGGNPTLTGWSASTNHMWASANGLYFVYGSSTTVYVTSVNEAYRFRNEVQDARFGSALVMGGVLYVTWGFWLYSLSSSLVPTRLGYLAGGDGFLSTMDTDGTNLVIVNNGGTTSGVGQVSSYSVAGGYSVSTDSDLVGVTSCAHLDSRFWYSKDGQVIGSAINDPLTADSADFVTAESFDDDVVRVMAVDQLLYFFGTNSIEVWYSSGVGRPPIDRQSVIDGVGLKGSRGVTEIDNTIYWINDQAELCRMRGSDFEIISIPGLKRLWTDDQFNNTVPILSSFSYQQENFVHILFSGPDEGWTYHEPSGTMIRHLLIASDVERQVRVNRFITVPEYSDKTYAVYRLYDTLGVLDDTTNQVRHGTTSPVDEMKNMIRRLDTGIITSELFGSGGREMICNGLRVTVQADGAGTLGVALSTDLSTFGTERSVPLVSGTHTYELRRWGKFREGIFRMTVTDDIKVDFLDLEAEVELLYE